MRIAFFGNYLAKRAKQGEGSSAHFFGIASGLQKLGHTILLPENDAKHFSGATRFSLFNPFSLWHVDIVYVRMEGRPVPMPWYLSQPFLRKLFAPKAAIVWEINAAPEMLAFNGRHLSPAMLRTLEDAIRRQSRDVNAAICNTNGLCQFAQDIAIPITKSVELATFPNRFGPAQHLSPNLEVCWLVGNSGISWHDTECIAAAITLLQEEDRIRFHIIGHQVQLKPARNVVLHGRVTGPSLSTMLEKMDVGLAIYREGIWSRYGVFTSPLKVFDYMASGLHIIASPIEQTKKLLQRGASVTVVPFDDPAAVAKILKSTVKDSTFLSGCEINRGLAVDYYNWQRASESTHRFFEEVVKSRKSNAAVHP